MPTDTDIAREAASILERTIQVDGVVTRYLPAGTGLPLVLLHGAGDNARDGRRQLHPLDRAPTPNATGIPFQRRYRDPPQRPVRPCS